MEKITIVLHSTLTVPAIKGGAVEVLLENFLLENEKHPRFFCTVIAHYVKGVEKTIEQYKYCRFVFIKFPTNIIRINSVLINRFKMQWLPNIWENALTKAVCKSDDEKILIEGGVSIIHSIRKHCPDRKIYYHLHADIPLYKNSMELANINSLECIICVSDYIRRRQISYGVNPERVKTVLNGIDIEQFDIEKITTTNVDIRKEFGLPLKGSIILFKGRIVREKGILELMEAFSKIQDKDVYLVLAGAKNFGEKRYRKSNYEKQVLEKVKGDKRIIVLGHVDYNKMPMLHKIANIAVVPSIWQEPCGLVVIEAIVSGIPLIVSKTGGIPEVIDGTQVISVDVDDKYIDNLSQALIDVLYDASLCSQISKSELEKRGFLSNERYVDELCILLEK